MRISIRFSLLTLLVAFWSISGSSANAGELSVRPQMPQVGGNTALIFKPGDDYPGNPFLVARVYGFTALSTEPVERSTVLSYERASDDFRGQFFADQPFVYVLIDFTDGNLTYNNNGKYYELYMYNREQLAPFALQTAAMSYYGIGSLQRRHNVVTADSLSKVGQSLQPSPVFESLVNAYVRDSIQVLQEHITNAENLQTEYEFAALLRAAKRYKLVKGVESLTELAFERFPNSVVLMPFYTVYFADDKKGAEYVQQYVEIARNHAEVFGKEATEHLFEDVFHYYHKQQDYEQAKQLIEEEYVHPHMSIALARSIAKSGDMTMALEIVNSAAAIAQQKIRWFEENINNDIVKYNKIIRDNARLLFVLALMEYEDGLNDDIVLGRIAQGLELIERDVTEQDYEQVLDVYLSNGKLKDAFSVILAAAKNDMLNSEMYKTGEGVFEEINRRRVGEDTTSFATVVHKIGEDRTINDVNGAFDRMYKNEQLSLYARNTDGSRWSMSPEKYVFVVYGGNVQERTQLLDSLVGSSANNHSDHKTLLADNFDFVVWNEGSTSENIRAQRDNTSTNAHWVISDIGNLAQQYGMSTHATWMIVDPGGAVLFDALNAELPHALSVIAREKE